MKIAFDHFLLTCLLLTGTLLLAQEQPLDSSAWSISLEDIVVTATYSPTHSRSAIHEVRVLDSKDIQRLQSKNLQQLLSADAGIRINEDRFLGSKTTLLGIGGQNVKVMIDGVPVIGRVDGNIDLAQIDLSEVQQVEIVEGPLSVNYGTDALAGVINLITKKSQLETYQLGMDASYETQGERTVSIDMGFKPDSRWIIGLNGGFDRFDGIESDSSRQMIWKPKDQKYGTGSLRFIPNESHDFKYRFNWLDESILNEGELRRPQFKPYAFDERYRTERMDHAIHYDGSYSNGWFLRSFFAVNRFRRHVDVWRQDIESGEQSTIKMDQDTSEIVGYNWRTTLSHDLPQRKLQYMMGWDVRYDNTRGGRIASTDPKDTYILDNAAFLSLRYRPIDALAVETGLRYALNNRYETPLIPSLNLKYELNQNWTFRASYGKGFRSPDIKELFFNFIDVNHFIVGNEDLVPETSNNYQLGFTYYRFFRGQEVTMGFKTFFNDITNKIDLYEYLQTPGGPVPVTDTVTNTYTYFNLDKFRTAGFGLRFGYDELRWRVRLGYNLTGQYNPGLDDQFSDNNRYAFSNEISIDTRYIIPVVDLDVNALIRYYDRLISFYPAENDMGEAILGKRIQDGYTMLDIMFGRSFWNDRFKINAGIRNLLNVGSSNVRGEEDGRHVASSTALFVSPGRSFYINTSFNLAWD